jgi:hypothetical protein
LEAHVLAGVWCLYRPPDQEAVTVAAANRYQLRSLIISCVARCIARQHAEHVTQQLCQLVRRLLSHH